MVGHQKQSPTIAKFCIEVRQLFNYAKWLQSICRVWGGTKGYIVHFGATKGPVLSGKHIECTDTNTYLYAGCT